MNEPLIQSLVDQVHSELAFVDHEVVVVDKSDPALSLSSARVLRQNSRGLGHAILEGVATARGEIVAVIDGDFSHRPEDLSCIVRKLGPQDFILGSSYIERGKNLDIPYRRIVSWLFNRLARVILGLEFSDPMSGLIVARKAVFEKNPAKPHWVQAKFGVDLSVKTARVQRRGSSDNLQSESFGEEQSEYQRGS